MLIDIDTQSHFFRQRSSVCIRNPRGILGNIRKVMCWAQTQHVPTISTLQLHPSHATCLPVPKTCRLSINKPSCTVCRNHLCLPAADTMDWSISAWDRYDQIILQKRYFDPFEELRIDRILTELPVEEYILIGAPLEGAVRATALGLLLRRKKVTMITNAIGKFDYVAGQRMLDKMSAKGARLVSANALVGSKMSAPRMSLH
jgi:nicotinamidase-related amidase